MYGNPRKTPRPFDVVAANIPTAAPKVMRILLVEDSLADAVLIKHEIARTFIEGSYFIEVARTKAQAMKLLAQDNFDGVLLDISLPDAVRLESLIELQINHPKVPVVVLSGYEDEEFAVSAVGNGAQDYLVKHKVSGNAIRRSLYYAIQRKSLEIELKAARQEAETANRVKSEFMAAMSHELRTPLNAISGFAQILAIDTMSFSTEKRVDYAESIITASDHLLKLINDILDLAKIEAGKIEMNLSLVQGTLLLTEIERLIAPLAKDKDISLQAIYDTEYCVKCDYVRLRQILINLASNAIKYNHDGGEVLLQMAEAKGQVRFSVKDNGIGIPLSRQGEIFQPFNRLGAEKGKTQGTGIGLTICKSLIEEMGGAIGFESVEGEGSCFWVELPGLREA